jgi:hypothetical protein
MWIQLEDGMFVVNKFTGTCKRKKKIRLSRFASHDSGAVS